MIVRIVSCAVEESSCTTRPLSKRTTMSRTTVPSISTSGLLDATTPSTRDGSGEVKTSSVGRLGMCGMPSAVEKRAACHEAPSKRPTVRSVPGPV